MLVEREQRNKIFHYLNEKGLPWEDFEFTEMEDGRIRELGLGNFAVTARMNMRRRTHITQAVKVLGFGDPIDYTDAFDEIDTQMEAGHKCRKIVEIHDRQTLTVLINDDWEIEDVVRGDALKEHPEGLLLTMIRMEELIPVSERTIRFPIRLRAQQLSNANEEEILKLAIDMSEALEEAHKRKIIHRDVKLENIFYDEDGIYKLGDFGIARMEDAQLKSRAMTRGYGAPEIDRRGYDERVDMYSLGMTLYLLLNDLKFPGSRSYRVNEDLQYVPDAVLPEPVNGSPALKAIIMKMCAYSPKDRYASMTELRGLFSGMLQKRYKENGMEKNRVLLKDLLQYDPITIQVPDHPEAGALAGAYGLYCYFSRQGIDTRLVCGGSGNYRGKDLSRMIRHFAVSFEDPDTVGEAELLITVDCQYGEKNMQKIPAKHIVVLDHHKSYVQPLPEDWEIHPNYASCVTLVWDMLIRADYDGYIDRTLATAFYYGLYMDTAGFQNMKHPRDRDLRDAMEPCCEPVFLQDLQNNSLSGEDLRLVGEAVSKYHYLAEHHCAVVRTAPCDMNIMGMIGQIMMKVEKVDISIVYHITDGQLHFSLKSCLLEAGAKDLSEWFAAEDGVAWGDMQNGGGSMPWDSRDKSTEVSFVDDFLEREVNRFFETQEIYRAGGDDVPDLSGENLYEKKELRLGYVKATDLYPVGTAVIVRMLEGDLEIVIKEDTYLIIGAEDEVYKNDEKYFLSHNIPTEEKYEFHGEYAPQIHQALRVCDGEGTENGEKRMITDYAKICITKKGSRIRARELDRPVKVQVTWSRDYLHGKTGDFLVAREEDAKDIYIIDREMFFKTYDRV